MKILPKYRRFRPTRDFQFELNIPGPHTLHWSLGTGADRVQHTRDHPIPVVTGLAFAATPFVVGTALVAFAPHPALKMAGASMLVPTGVGEIFWFTVGYGVGMEIEDRLGL